MHLLVLLLGLLRPPVVAAPAPVVVPEVVSAAAVLHEWDHRRARAWASSSPRALRALYADGSVAGSRDVRLLRDYRVHRLVVRRLETQVFALTVLRHDGRHLRLRVLDRVAGGEVYDGQRARPLGTTPPATRDVELSLAQGRWRVVWVSGSGRAPRRAPPVRRGR